MDATNIRIDKIQPLIKVMTQWALGQSVEVKHRTDPHGVWVERENPEWNFAEYEFRVKARECKA